VAKLWITVFLELNLIFKNHARVLSASKSSNKHHHLKVHDFKVSAAMRLLATLLPALLGAASAASEQASVYIFQGSSSSPSSNPPTLTPEQARLVFAQRLGISQFHGLGDAKESTLSYINKFGGRREESLFEDEAQQDQAAELVLVVEDVEAVSKPLLSAWESIKPAFTISNPPSMLANRRLMVDLNNQAGERKNCALEDAINPFEVNCWSGKSKVIHFDLVGKV
jgi:hypothetical protein